jgi:hypothetical protein
MDVKSFTATLYRKYRTILDLPANDDPVKIDIRLIDQVCTKVSMTNLTHIALARQWCDENFGDNWIYSWGDFYFKNSQDALIFSLAWVL